jgi:hypothetical protein
MSIVQKLGPTTTITALLAATLLLAACSSDAGDQPRDKQDADTGADVHASDADVHEPDADVDEPDASADAPAEDTGGEDASTEPDAGADADSGPTDTGSAEDASPPEDTGPDSSGSLCDSVTPLEDDPEWSQATDILWPFGDSEPQTFAHMFNFWPGSGNSNNLGLLKGEYFALSFQTGQLDATSKGQLAREMPAGAGGGSSIGTGPLIASFSRCPGDFDPNSPAVPSPDCVMSTDNLINQIRWGGPGSGRDCELDSNTQYYFNVVYTDSDIGQLPPVQATCRDDRPRCGHLWRASGSE